MYQREIFPQRTTGFGESQLVTFDLAYYPTDKGPYNYDATGITANGKLRDPAQRWGGLMRSIDQPILKQPISSSSNSGCRILSSIRPEPEYRQLERRLPVF